MTEPLRITFGVACRPERTFELRTARTSTWWPTSHTVSARPGVEIILETGVGGRIFERIPAGHEHDWGQVTRWEPQTGSPSSGIYARTVPMDRS